MLLTKGLFLRKIEFVIRLVCTLPYPFMYKVLGPRTWEYKKST